MDEQRNKDVQKYVRHVVWPSHGQPPSATVSDTVIYERLHKEVVPEKQSQKRIWILCKFRTPMVPKKPLETKVPREEPKRRPIPPPPPKADLVEMLEKEREAAAWEAKFAELTEAAK